MSALWFECALNAHPEIETEMAQGEFGTLRGWLTEKIHQHGRKFTISELVERVTGEPLKIDAYIHHLQTKYGELYGLSFG
jgi:carboxypeptidase Taq